jgi:hypothetical protein
MGTEAVSFILHYCTACAISKWLSRYRQEASPEIRQHSVYILYGVGKWGIFAPTYLTAQRIACRLAAILDGAAIVLCTRYAPIHIWIQGGSEERGFTAGVIDC